MLNLPVCARLDGRAFHSFTRGLERPYDRNFSELMLEVLKYLVEETGACMGYTQSDEISLIFRGSTLESQIFFDGRIHKMVSTLAAMASVKFNRIMPSYLPEKKHTKMPTFDCRVWEVPDRTEATNVLVWREQDATKNSISMAAQSVFSHKALHGKNCSDMQDMLMEKGINWNDYPDFFKRGVYVQRRKVVRKFTSEELENLPEKHEARKNPDLMVERSIVAPLEMPVFTRVLNRVGVVFDGQEPIVLKGDSEKRNPDRSVKVLCPECGGGKISILCDTCSWDNNGEKAEQFRTNLQEGQKTW
jgi:tRNA(His) 5'-end guanylyltransferase